MVVNLVRGRWLFLVVRYLGNHEFPDHEKNDFNLDFLLLISCFFIHEFPFFKIKQQDGNCFTRYLQRREKQFPDKQFLYLFRNHSECCIWILKPLQYRTSHMSLKKSNLGIHDVSKHLNREIDSQLDQIIFDLGIHDVDKNVIGFSLPIITFFCFCRIPQLHLDKTTHKYIIIGSTNSCSLGTRAGWAARADQEASAIRTSPVPDASPVPHAVREPVRPRQSLENTGSTNMKFIRQFLIILAISLVGEILKYILPLPIPASIYGMAILFAGLMSGLIKLDAVRETGKFLIEIMPLMFIPAGVGLMDSWGNLHPILLPVAIITIVTNITVMGSTGLLSQWVIRRGRKLAEEKTERKRGAYHE